jgi:hypothetical protein
MNQYKVFLKGWQKDLDISLIVFAKTQKEAKGIYIKTHLKNYVNAGFSKNSFFFFIVLSIA